MRCDRRQKLLPPGRAQVAQHSVVGCPQRGGSAELRSHVGDGRLAGGADGARAGADVLDDGVGGTGDAQHPGHVQDDVLGRGPSAKLPGQVDGDRLGVEQLPRQPGDDLHGIRAADPHRAGAEPPGVGGVRVGADDHKTRRGVVFEHHLMHDPRARLPELRAVARRRRAQKLVDLVVLEKRGAQIGEPVGARLNQVIAVNARRHRHLLLSGLHELEHARLPQHILKDHAIRAQQEVALTAQKLLPARVVEVAKEDLVSQGQRTAQPGADLVYSFFHRLVDFFHVSKVAARDP